MVNLMVVLMVVLSEIKYERSSSFLAKRLFCFDFVIFFCLFFISKTPRKTNDKIKTKKYFGQKTFGQKTAGPLLLDLRKDDHQDDHQVDHRDPRSYYEEFQCFYFYFYFYFYCLSKTSRT